jgi:hypothetical protein
LIAINDNTGDFFDISIWSGLEVSMGIFAVSAPAMKPIIKRFALNLWASLLGYTPSQDRTNQSSTGRAWRRSGHGIELRDKVMSHSSKNGVITTVSSTGKRDMKDLESGKSQEYIASDRESTFMRLDT